ncbi:MAG: FAD-dependent oxidoreductase, partial [Actinomycetota bacterium]
MRPVSINGASPVLGSADVVIVGFGAAGAAAAIEAARAGATVLVLERAGGPGGAAAQAGGIIYLGGGTPTQRGAGIADSPEAMETYLLAACGPEPDRAKISEYVKGNLEHHQFFVDCGVEFEPSLCESVQMESPGTEGLVWSGGENAFPFNQLTKPAPRGHLARTKGATGWLLMEKLHDTAIQLGVNVEYDLRAERLVLDAGRVVGVEASRFGATGTFLARGGVVVAAGGFIHNEEMLAAGAPSVLG